MSPRKAPKGGRMSAYLEVHAETESCFDIRFRGQSYALSRRRGGGWELMEIGGEGSDIILKHTSSLGALADVLLLFEEKLKRTNGRERRKVES
jgi:hypothetical protein